METNQHQWDETIPISSIEFDYKPSIAQPPAQIEEGNLYTNMEKMIEVWKHLDLQEGRHPKMVDIDIIGGGGDINSLDLDLEQIAKIANHSKLLKGELKGRSSNTDRKRTLPTDDIENHLDDGEDKSEPQPGLIQNPNSILKESGWTPLVISSLPGYQGSRRGGWRGRHPVHSTQ